MRAGRPQRHAQIIKPGEPLPAAPEPEHPAAVLDLMAALQESVSKMNVSCGEEPEPAKVHELPKPKQKTAAKKTSATGLTRYGLC